MEIAFDVTARRYEDSVQYQVSANDIKEALKKAHSEANNIFDYQGLGDEPKVSVKEAKIKDNGGAE